MVGFIKVSINAVVIGLGLASMTSHAQQVPLLPFAFQDGSIVSSEPRPQKAQKQEFGGQERLILNNGLEVPGNDNDGSPAQAMGNGWVSYKDSSGRFLVLKPIETGGLEVLRTYPGQARESWTLEAPTTADVVAILGGATQAAPMAVVSTDDPFFDDGWMDVEPEVNEYTIADESMGVLEAYASEMFEESDEVYDDFFTMDEEYIDGFVEAADNRSSFKVFLDALGQGIMRDLTFSINKQGNVFIGVKKITEYDPVTEEYGDYFVMGNGERIPTIIEGSEGQISIDTSEIIYADGSAIYVDMRTGDTVYRRADGSELRKEPALAEIFLSFLKRAIDGVTDASEAHGENQMNDNEGFEDYVYEDDVCCEMDEQFE